MSAKTYRVLVINPGSTSTKLGLFENETLAVEEIRRHDHGDISQFDSVLNQKDMRMSVIQEFLEHHRIDPAGLDAVVGRGGIVEPIDSGVYRINERMLADLRQASGATHASALGGILAAELARQYGLPAFVADPVVVDELDQNARLTGLPGIERRCVFHALNQKAVARRCAHEMGLHYDNCRFVVAHMGGGITVGAHRYGRVIDVNDAMGGEGPFSPERSGGLPAEQLIRLCYSGAYTLREMLDKVTHRGGVVAYLGTNDIAKVERLIKEGDDFAALVLESMAYQVAKEIGAMVAVLEGRVDAIILTGGLAKSTRFTGAIKNRVSLIAPIKVFPGEDELRALAKGALRALRGEEDVKEY